MLSGYNFFFANPFVFLGISLTRRDWRTIYFVQFMLFRNESLKLNDKVLKEVVPSKVFFNIIKII